jgi:hypothetical protein
MVRLGCRIKEDTVIAKAYTQALGGKGIYNPGLSEMGMYHRISLY